MAAYNERQILSQVQYNSIKSKHGPFCRILHRGFLLTKPYFFLLQVFLAWKEVCFDRIDKVRKSVQFFLPPSEPPMFKPSQLPTPVSRYQGKVSRKSSVLAWTSQCEPHGHWSKSCVLLLQYSARWIFYWTYFGLYVYVWLGYYCVLVFKYEEDCLMCQHSSQYIYKLTVCTSCATF